MIRGLQLRQQIAQTVISYGALVLSRPLADSKSVICSFVGQRGCGTVSEGRDEARKRHKCFIGGQRADSGESLICHFQRQLKDKKGSRDSPPVETG